MSMHLKIPAYTCKKCKTDFMAYSKGLKCPKCNQPEESQGEGYNFIDKQVGAMIWHKNLDGDFRGRVWSNFCLCDAIQWNIFNAFDYASQNPDIGWENWAKNSYILDGDGKELKNEQYFHNLYKAIDEGLKARANEITVKDIFDKESGKFLPETYKKEEESTFIKPPTTLIEKLKKLFSNKK